MLYRSNLLGSDLRITNFGGGNTSAKVEMTDPLTKKRSGAVGERFGRRYRLYEARRLCHALYGQAHALKGLYNGLAHEDEMVDDLTTAPSISIRARPRSTRCLHGLCRVPMSITSIPMR